MTCIPRLRTTPRATKIRFHPIFRLLSPRVSPPGNKEPNRIQDTGRTAWSLQGNSTTAFWIAGRSAPCLRRPGLWRQSACAVLRSKRAPDNPKPTIEAYDRMVNIRLRGHEIFFRASRPARGGGRRWHPKRGPPPNCPWPSPAWHSADGRSCRTGQNTLGRRSTRRDVAPPAAAEFAAARSPYSRSRVPTYPGMWELAYSTSIASSIRYDTAGANPLHSNEIRATEAA